MGRPKPRPHGKWIIESSSSSLDRSTTNCAAVIRDTVVTARDVDEVEPMGCRTSAGTVRLFGVRVCWAVVGLGMWLCGGLGQAVAGRPTTSFQVVNRVVISCRYWSAVSRWRRGRKWGFDLPQAQREAVIQPHTVTDDLPRVAVPLVQRRRGVHEPSLTHPHQATDHPNPVNLTMPRQPSTPGHQTT
jgi:hypothetical protein